MMYSEEVLERLKSKIPTIKGDHTIYGITQLDVTCEDGSLKQIVLAFERLKVFEPETKLTKKQIYADVLVKIRDEDLIDIATKTISIEDAISEKMFKVFGDAEIWKLQLTALEELLSDEHFEPKRKKQPEVEVVDTCDLKEEENVDPKDKAFGEDWIDYGNLPEMDLSDVGPEFKVLTDHFIALRSKYVTKKVTFDERVKKE